MVGACLLLLGACAGGADAPAVDTIVDPTTTDDPIEWLPCGAVECGTFTVPVDHTKGQSAAGVVDLVLFRRRAAVAGAPVLVLVGDRTRADEVDTTWGARALAERADLVLGSGARSFEVISVAMRGSAEMRFPPGSIQMVGSLDVADDLELLRREGLKVDTVRVIGWGDGATAVAAWVMRHPASIEAAVLDSPVDPAVSLAEQTEALVLATDAAADWAVRWCASHLSCPGNAKPANTVDLVVGRIEGGTAPEGFTLAVLARAAETALSAGNPNLFWEALTEAAEGREDLISGLAGPVPSIEDVRPLCRDTGAETARSLLALLDAADPVYFPVGSVRERLASCADTLEQARPIGALPESDSVAGAAVLVTGSASDPVRPASIMKAMAKRNEWIWKPSPAVRHLVVGREAVPTAAAMAHLAGN